MKIVLNTKVLLAALFFGGYPRQIVEAVVEGRVAAYATREIVEEYEAVIAKMRSRKQEGLPANLLLPFTSRLHIVEPKYEFKICRNPYDNRFASCAMAAHALYIADDGKKISFINAHRSIKIVNAKGFCQMLSLCA